MRDDLVCSRTFSDVGVEQDGTLRNRRNQPEFKFCVREFDQRVSDSLATPFPATLAAHFLGQVKLEKNCLANGTGSHPHGFSPLIPSISKKEGFSDCLPSSP